MEGIGQIQNGEQMSSVRNKLNQVIAGAVSHDEAAEEFVAQDQTGVQEVSDSDTIVSPNIMFRATLTQDSETAEAKISGADLLNAMQQHIGGGGGGSDYRPISNADIPAVDFSPETLILDDTIQFNVTEEEATAKKVNGDQLIAAVRHALGGAGTYRPAGNADIQQLDYSETSPILDDNTYFNVTDSNDEAKKVKGSDLLAAIQAQIGGGGDWASVPEITSRPDEDQMDNYYIPLRDRDGNYYKMPLRLVFE